MQLALMFWADADADTNLGQLKSFGLHAGQLGIPPSMACTPEAAAEWRAAIKAHGVSLSGAVCAYAGEDYSSMAHVHRTVGFTAPGYTAARIARTREISAFAAKLGLAALSCHIGFIPEDSAAPLYTDLLTIARELCDACAEHAQSFVLETGQESAATLLRFLEDVARPNLRVNFDPANMILYGSGDPIAALRLLSRHVLSVHCKDGHSPAAQGELGHECALGDGEVDFPAFLATLRDIGYTGLLTIEREEPDLTRRSADIRLGITRLQQWQQSPRMSTAVNYVTSYGSQISTAETKTTYRPAAAITYWWPSSRYVCGALLTRPMRVFQIGLPSAASYATRLPTPSPVNTRPPAVASTPPPPIWSVWNGRRHAALPV